MPHRSTTELDAGLPEVLAAPRRHGTLERIVRRPLPGEREVLDEAQLDIAVGLVGDRWCIGTPEKPPHPGKQITIMSSRVAALLAGGGDWAPAGDQLFVDLDLTEEHLPAGARLSIGGAVLEVTADPHTGCKKFAQRFGEAAVAWTKSPERVHLRLRGLHARVIVPGTIRRGDKITVADS
jgi:MOSC domain-containing protein YiiM